MSEIIPSEMAQDDHHRQKFVENALDNGFGKITRPVQVTEEGDCVEIDGVTFDVVSVESQDFDDLDAPEDVVEQFRDAYEDGVAYTHRLEPRE